MRLTKKLNDGEPSAPALQPGRNRAVRWSASLGQGFISLSILFLVSTIARKNLAAANWTLFSVTADNVKLPLDDSAIVTRMAVRPPILLLLAVSDPLNLSAADGVAGL